MDLEQVARQLFLSPGDRTEWTFEAKAEEAVLITVTSSVFDPAVAIVDESGKKLAENDDIEPGNQMARVLTVIPKTGKFKAVITNYKGTAGGAFSFEAHRFSTLALPIGTAVSTNPRERKSWLRATFDEPGEYVLSVRNRPYGTATMLSPGGESLGVGWNPPYQQAYQRSRIQINMKGTYLIGLPSEQPAIVKVAPVGQYKAAVGSDDTFKLAEDQVGEWTVPVATGDLLEFEATGNAADPLGFQLQGIAAERERAVEFSQIHVMPYPMRVLVTVLRGGNLKMIVSHPQGTPTTFKLRASRVGQPWLNASTHSASLAWYGADVWYFTGRIGDVLSLRGGAPAYLLQAKLVHPDGQVTPLAQSGVPPTVSIDSELRQTGRYLLVVSGSGTGPYRFDRAVVEPQRLGPVVSNGVMQDKPQVWRFHAEAGQDLALRISSPTLRWRMGLSNGAGQYLGGATRGTGPNDDLIRFRVEVSGDYTLTVASLDGSQGAYEIKRVDLNADR